VAGARCEAEAVAEEFGQGRPKVMVVGMLRGKDAREMLEALDAARSELVVACPAPSPRTQPPEVIAEAARSLGVKALVAPSVPDALEAALAEAGEEGLVLVTGSLYVAGEARKVLRTDVRLAGSAR
jgi:dihydrofolate synthase/folylpolyglutamate synthase